MPKCHFSPQSAKSSIRWIKSKFKVCAWHKPHAHVSPWYENFKYEIGNDCIIYNQVFSLIYNVYQRKYLIGWHGMGATNQVFSFTNDEWIRFT